MDRSPPDSSVHGFLQARILEWGAMPFSRGSSRPRDRTLVSHVSCIAGRFFTHWATWEALLKGYQAVVSQKNSRSLNKSQGRERGFAGIYCFVCHDFDESSYQPAQCVGLPKSTGGEEEALTQAGATSQGGQGWNPGIWSRKCFWAPGTLPILFKSNQVLEAAQGSPLLGPSPCMFV